MKIRHLAIASVALMLTSGIASADDVKDKVADRIDNRGDRIENRLDNKGDRIDQRLDN